MDALTRHRLARIGLDPAVVEAQPLDERIETVHAAFVRSLPCETLSRLRTRRAQPHAPDAWTRGTDRVLRDHETEGSGGCCFELAYALAAVFRGVGAVAHATLARPLVGEDAHAAVLTFRAGGAYLHDPGHLVPAGVPVRPGGTVHDALHDHVLEPRGGATLLFVRRGPDGVRVPLYALVALPAPADGFRRAWLDAALHQRDGESAISRRRGDLLESWDERDGRVEVTTPTGRRLETLGSDPAADLHRRFGLSEPLLRANLSPLRT